MDWNHVETRWKQARHKVKEKWFRLTDEDLKSIQGRRDRLERKIQERYGFATSYVQKEIEGWLRWQLPISRRSHKTKLASRAPKRRRTAADWGVTAIYMHSSNVGE
jgi:uncharacterized protein YjbJ (UPF0337 family)